MLLLFREDFILYIRPQLHLTFNFIFDSSHLRSLSAFPLIASIEFQIERPFSQGTSSKKWKIWCIPWGFTSLRQQDFFDKRECQKFSGHSLGFFSSLSSFRVQPTHHFKDWDPGWQFKSSLWTGLKVFLGSKNPWALSWILHSLPFLPLSPLECSTGNLLERFCASHSFCCVYQ